MKCRWCVKCFRRVGLLKVALIAFVTLLLFCFTSQLHQLPLSSAKVINKKASVPEMADQVLPRRSENHSNIAQGASRHKIIGNGRSPKQVNENIKHRPVNEGSQPEGNQPITSNHTLRASTVLMSSMTSAHVDSLPSLSGPSSLEILQEVMLKANKAQTIYNQDHFPPLGEDGLVLIVQVHKREGYLKQLLESLKVAKGIEKVLLVISHDYYYDDMNKLIRTIDFCPVSMRRYSSHIFN